MMNITNRIKRDIDIYNGQPTLPDMPSSYSAFSIFTTTNLKIVAILGVFLLIIFYLYNTNLYINDYQSMFKKVIDIIKTRWNNLLMFINKSTNKITSSLYGDTDKKKIESPKNTINAVQNRPQQSQELDTIKSALDTNALKYIATTEQQPMNADDIPGWCYIGKNTADIRVCAKTTNENLCESNMFYQKEEQCTNQP